MKLWKKAAAAVLAAVMSLTLLTGCSGGGGGASVTYTRDTEKEKQVTEWIQNYAKLCKVCRRDYIGRGCRCGGCV